MLLDPFRLADGLVAKAVEATAAEAREAAINARRSGWFWVGVTCFESFNCFLHSRQVAWFVSVCRGGSYGLLMVKTVRPVQRSSGGQGVR